VEDFQRSASSKLKILKKAKDTGSFISKKDILSFADGEYDSNSAGNSAPDLKTVIPRSLRDVKPPSDVSEVPHPAKWLWNHPDLTLCMDEHGNTYYYNFETEESTWDAPEDLNLPRAEITFHVVVPKYATPGVVFHVNINGTQIEVMCPMNVTPGMVLELSNDTPLLNTETVEEVDEANIDSHIDIPPHPRGAGATSAKNDGNEEVKDEAHSTPDASPAVPEPPRTVDDETLWTALAEAAGIEVYSIMSDADTSTSILHDVANGSYFNELIFQVGWAYRFNLLKGALFIFALPLECLIGMKKYHPCLLGEKLVSSFLCVSHQQAPRVSATCPAATFWIRLCTTTVTARPGTRRRASYSGWRTCSPSARSSGPRSSAGNLRCRSRCVKLDFSAYFHFSSSLAITS